MKYCIGFIVAFSLLECVQQPSEPPARPAQAGQALNPAETATRMAALRASAMVGDQKGVERQMNAMHSDLMRSMKVPDASRTIDKEAARTAARQVAGVRSVVWVDNTHLLAIVDRNELRSHETIDHICLQLEPLGDTLAVVVSVQSGAARNGDELEVLSRNCQLAPGDHAFMQRPRQIDVIDPDVRRQHRANQANPATPEDDAAMKALLESTPEL